MNSQKETHNMLSKGINSLTKQQRIDLFAKGITSSVMSMWRTGKRKPTYAQCVTLADITGIDLQQLLLETALNEAEPEQQEKFKHLLKNVD